MNQKNNILFLSLFVLFFLGGVLLLLKENWNDTKMVEMTESEHKNMNNTPIPTPHPTNSTNVHPTQESEQKISIKINQNESALGVGITVLEVLDDSRCAVDVQCIWAGTVKVRALLEGGLGKSEQVFVLNEPITTESEIVTLVEVDPSPKAGEIISKSDYTFIFKIEKR